MASTIWRINENPSRPSAHMSAQFSTTYDGSIYNGIDSLGFSSWSLQYLDSDDAVMVYSSSTGWTDQGYRIVMFRTEPTGELLTWLQANAVKQ